MKLTKLFFNGFRPRREAISESLGKLERAVMKEVWRRGYETSVRDVYLAFGEQVAYTTVMTTLDRLYKKGLLKRRKEGRAFLYQSNLTAEELERNVAEDVIGGLLSGEPEKVEPVLSCIVDAVSDCDRDLLDELERLVQQKRRELESEE